MKGKDQIEQLFSDKLGNFEAKVDPSMWSAVSTQIGAQTGAAASGMSILTKAIIGISAASVITVGAVLLNHDDNKKPIDKNLVANQEVVKPVRDFQEEDKVVVDQETTANRTGDIVVDATPVLVDETPVHPLDLSNDELIAEGPADFELFEEDNTEKVIKEEEEFIQPELVIEETNNEIEVEAEEIELYSIESLPNIFTPNNDGNNDVFKLETKGLTDFNITILNNNNQVVYQSNDLRFEWRGQDLSHNNCAEGNYVYYITARDSAGNAVNKYSQLLLRR